jgi:hypothetical protein
MSWEGSSFGATELRPGERTKVKIPNSFLIEGLFVDANLRFVYVLQVEVLIDNGIADPISYPYAVGNSAVFNTSCGL